MIDSVILILKTFKLLEHWEQLFDGTKMTEVRDRFRQQSFFPKNLNEKMKREEKYFPQITLIPKKDIIYIQVSLPKLIFGTNLLEIDESYLNEICEKLSKSLREVSVIATPGTIRTSPLKNVAFCKNFQVPVWMGTSKQLIWKISELGHKRSSNSKLDIFSKENNKDGSLLKFWNTTQGYAIYDKEAEILANGKTNIERAIQEKVISNDYQYNVIRFELTLQIKQSLDAFLKRRVEGKEEDFCLEDALKKELSKKILLEAFDNTFKSEHLFTLGLAEIEENKLERYLLQQELPLSEHYLLSYWINKTIKNGLPATLKELKDRTSSSTLNRQKKKLKDISEKIITPPSSMHNIANYFKEKHEEFKILKPS